MKKIQSFALFVSVVFNFLAENVLSSDCKSKLGATLDCTKECPSAFGSGSCQFFEGKLQCVCGKKDNLQNFYTADDAKKEYKACHQKNHNAHGCYELCPETYHGHCSNKAFGEYRCYCISKENKLYSTIQIRQIKMESVCYNKKTGAIDCNRLCPSMFPIGQCQPAESQREKPYWDCVCKEDLNSKTYYSVSEAFAISGCRSDVPDNSGCEVRCPSSFSNGKCEKTSNGNGPRDCFCTHNKDGYEWYSIKEANQIQRGCEGTNAEVDATLKKNVCADLCSFGYKYGDCIKKPKKYSGHCQCKINKDDKLGYPLYTARSMRRVCKKNNVSNAGCLGLCQRFKYSNGYCRVVEEVYECFCSTSKDVAYVPLNLIIHLYG